MWFRNTHRGKRSLKLNLKDPRGKELLWTCVNGFLILGVGNGCLTWSEQLIPSSLAALFITVSPFWLVGMESLIPGGDKLTRSTVLGMLVGFVGAGMDVTLLGPLPTPAVAMLTRSLRADLGVMISASHNLYEDNGMTDAAARVYAQLKSRMGDQDWVQGRLNDLMGKLGWDRLDSGEAK